jgi:hypothetical protein
MKPIPRALVISTIVVVVYPIVVLAVVLPLVVLWSGRFVTAVSNALMMPLDLPSFIMRSIHPSTYLDGRFRIELTIMLLCWYIVFNLVLYYVPIRLFLQWREQKIRLR